MAILAAMVAFAVAMAALAVAAPSDAPRGEPEAVVDEAAATVPPGPAPGEDLGLGRDEARP